MAENLTPKQRKAITALVAGRNFDEAAKAAGVSVRTLHRWRSDPLFMAELRAADSEQLGEIARVLNGASRDAVTVLMGVMNDAKAKPDLRIRAAGEILKHRASFFELTTLEARLTDLEARLKELHP
ncbi:MAG: hypothetical protein LC121_06855 [Anaerolineae bacterium]|nr:hypothetical protein [Anaerolineae bacterium]